MSEPLRALPENTIVTGWDFSTSAVKCVAFDSAGNTVCETRGTTDLWTRGGVSELSIVQLEGQIHSSVRAMAAELKDRKADDRWRVGGISATHHTAGRIDSHFNQVRRAIAWCDETLAGFHRIGLARLGGQLGAIARIGGPYAVRYSLSHLLKDEATLSMEDWQRTKWILPHGTLAAGYLTGRFDVISISSAASTGLMNLRTDAWCPAMLDALESPIYRQMAMHQLPRIVTDMSEPVGPLADYLAIEAGLGPTRPQIMPTLDDQAAGLLGGGAVDSGHLAIILGTSAVVNSSSARLPERGTLDAMKLNWGPFLWMRCYSNGAQFLDSVVGDKPDFDGLEAAARGVAPTCSGVTVMPFRYSEPSIGITRPCYRWSPVEPTEPGIRYRASLEALAYLMAMAVQEHIDAGQNITQITISGGISRSNLMGEILATVLNRPLKRLVSNEGPALGAAAAALAGAEQQARRVLGIPEPYTASDAVDQIIQFRAPVQPVPEWRSTYADGLRRFVEAVRHLAASG